MGSATSRRVCGHIHIEMETRNFQAGEGIHGTVHLYLIQAIQANGLFLVFKGEEVGMWNAYKSGYQQLENPGNVSSDALGKGHVANQRFPIFSFPQGTAQPGQFSFPFVLQLPADLPGSFHLEYGNIYARITYTITAFVGTAKCGIEPHVLISRNSRL